MLFFFKTSQWINASIKIRLFLALSLLAACSESENFGNKSGISKPNAASLGIAEIPTECSYKAGRSRLSELKFLHCLEIEDEKECQEARDTLTFAVSSLPEIFLEGLEDSLITIRSPAYFDLLISPNGETRIPIQIDESGIIVSSDPNIISYYFNYEWIRTWLENTDVSGEEYLGLFEEGLKLDIGAEVLNIMQDDDALNYNLDVLSSAIDAFTCNEESNEILLDEYPHVYDVVDQLLVTLDESTTTTDEALDAAGLNLAKDPKKNSPIQNKIEAEKLGTKNIANKKKPVKKKPKKAVRTGKGIQNSEWSKNNPPQKKTKKLTRKAQSQTKKKNLQYGKKVRSLPKLSKVIPKRNNTPRLDPEHRAIKRKGKKCLKLLAGPNCVPEADDVDATTVLKSGDNKLAFDQLQDHDEKVLADKYGASFVEPSTPNPGGKKDLVTRKGRRLKPLPPEVLNNGRHMNLRSSLQDEEKAAQLEKLYTSQGGFGNLNDRQRKTTRQMRTDQFLLENGSQFGGDPEILVRNARRQGFSPEEVNSVRKMAIEMQKFDRKRVGEYRQEHIKAGNGLARGKKPRTVIVTYEGGGGGHKAAAEAIVESLRKKNYIGQLVKKEKEDDQMGSVTEGGLNEMSYFNEGVQKGLDPFTKKKVNTNISQDPFSGLYRDQKGVMADQMDPIIEDTENFRSRMGNVNALARDYHRPNFNQKLTRMAANPQVLGVIDTSSHQMDANAAAVANNKPHLTWATDYGLSDTAAASAFNRDPKTSRVALTSAEPALNKAITRRGESLASQGGHRMAQKKATRTTDILARAGLPSKGRTIKNIAKQTNGVGVPLGYPIRSGIKPLSKKARKAVRDEMGVGPNDKMVAVTLGSQGKQETVEVVKRLANGSAHKGPGQMHVLVLPGENPALKAEIKSAWASQNPAANMSLRFPDDTDMPFGGKSRLGGQEMGKVYGGADLIITKPGGSATAELHAVGTPAITTAENAAMEGGNMAYLKASGLGTHMPIDNVDSLPGLVESRLQQGRPQLKSDYKPLDWESGLGSTLSEWNKTAEVGK